MTANRRSCLVFAALLALVPPARAVAAEIASNGGGGGAWSDPATWRGRQLPGPGDDVVVQKNDIVVFDRDEEGKPSCRKLLIDPRGGLSFKTNAGRLVLTVADGIECFGVIRLDGTKSASDNFELRLAGDPAKRVVKLGKGAALLLYGRRDLPGDRRNVALAAAAPEKDNDKDKDGAPVLVEADGAVVIDWQRAALRDVKLVAKKLDNTGAKPNERVKVSDCQFTGVGRLLVQNCDTPEIVRNTFECKAAKPLDEAAINVSYSPLAEIKHNHVRGGFAIGITVNYQSDSVLVGNVVERCAFGVTGGYGVPNTMLKDTVVRGCDTGVKLEGATGVVEDLLVEGAAVAFHMQNSNLQLNGFQAKDLAKKGLAVLHEGGTLSLLNGNVAAGQIKMAPTKGASVQCLHYVVVAAKGAPAGALVEIRTTKPAPAAGASDPNVRNSPAALADGLTPPPRSLTPLVVAAWSLDAAGKVQPPPEYEVRVLGPAAKEGADRPVLKSVPLRPAESAFRADLNDKTPTIEVLVK